MNNLRYSLYLIPLTTYIPYYNGYFQKYFKDDLVKIYEYDYLFDWIIKESISNYMLDVFRAHIWDHHVNDIGKTIYKEIGLYIDNYIHNELVRINFKADKSNIIKVMVCGDTLILAKGKVNEF